MQRSSLSLLVIILLCFTINTYNCNNNFSLWLVRVDSARGRLYEDYHALLPKLPSVNREIRRLTRK